MLETALFRDSLFEILEFLDDITIFRLAQTSHYIRQLVYEYHKFKKYDTCLIFPRLNFKGLSCHITFETGAFTVGKSKKKFNKAIERIGLHIPRLKLVKILPTFHPLIDRLIENYLHRFIYICPSFCIHRMTRKDEIYSLKCKDCNNLFDTTIELYQHLNKNPSHRC